MSTALKLFSYQGSSIRTSEINGEPIWMLKDVCDHFGDKHHIRNASYIDDEDKFIVPVVDSMGRTQNALMINISGLNTLLLNFKPKIPKSDGVPILAPHLEKRLKDIKAFQRWVTSVVLPSIMKTGSYSIAPQQPSIPQSFSEALQLAANQAKLIEQMQPKVNNYDKFIDASTTISQTYCAKLLGMNPRRFFDWLKEIEAEYKNNSQLIRNKYLKNRWFVQKLFPQEVTKNGVTEIHNRERARVTMLGLHELEKLAKEQGLIPQDYRVEYTPEKEDNKDQKRCDFKSHRENLDLTADGIQIDIDRILGGE